MSKKTKAFFYNFLGFSAFYLPTYFLIINFTHLEGFWIAGTAFMVSLLLSPKFQFVKTNDGEKIFMKWLFTKGVKEIK